MPTSKSDVQRRQLTLTAFSDSRRRESDERQREQQLGQASTRESVWISLGLEAAISTKLKDEIESAELTPSDLFALIGRRAYPWVVGPWFGDRDKTWAIAELLFIDVIETVTTIARIAESAVIYEIPIRWFDFGLFEKSRAGIGRN